MEAATAWLPLLFGAIGVGVAFALYRVVVAYPAGDAKVTDIAEQIYIGAMTFMRREFTILAVVGVILFFLLGFGLGWSSALAFVVGAVASGLAGFFGMRSATKANVRTATAAHTKGAAEALTVSFFGGSVMGLLVASLGLLGLGFLFLIFGANPETAVIIQSFGVGASSVALFFRVGGGIFTKSADVGADLVGKVEAGIPEDDPRNPGVIADNVGDNVGDVAGMGSDIFESNVGSIIATIAIGTTLGASTAIYGSAAGLMFLPLALASFGLLCSIAGIMFVRAVSAMAPALALRLGTWVAAGLFILVSYFVVDWIDVTNAVWWAVVAGSIGGILIGLVTEYYTGGPPVKHLAESSKTGTATVIIAGYSLGLQSVVIPVIGIALIILVASQLAGLYGVGIAAVGMLATVGFTMAIDGFGPIADNSGGIAEMGGMGKETRKITDSLDELGNTTAAIGKGFAIGAAALAALTIIAAYIQTMIVRFPEFQLSLGDPKVIMGMLIGGTIPFLVASITMNAVGDAAFAMIEEIRRQFREIPGLLEGKAGVKPDAASCVDIATTAALKKMILPGAIALGTPVFIGFVFGPVVLGGALAGALLATVLLALKMANSGGAWDNAKKYIEKGNLGGKGSANHAATVVGDTVGDPLKDTSGPSLNILIKLMAIVSLTIAPLLGASLF
jgi:K(+)-stimulated pyrophosphate-energized sodium pump